MNRIGRNFVTARIATMCCLALSGLSGTALAEDEYFPTEPPLADSGWTVPYNELLIACYRGDMDACDRVASDRGMVFDTPIYNYAATCGGRLDIVTRAASERSNVAERRYGRDVRLHLQT